MTSAANERLKNGETVFGLIIVPQVMPISLAIDELEIIILCSVENDFINQIKFLPFGLANFLFFTIHNFNQRKI
jgi:hypothetical protein